MSTSFDFQMTQYILTHIYTRTHTGLCNSKLFEEKCWTPSESLDGQKRTDRLIQIRIKQKTQKPTQTNNTYQHTHINAPFQRFVCFVVCCVTQLAFTHVKYIHLMHKPKNFTILPAIPNEMNLGCVWNDSFQFIGFQCYSTLFYVIVTFKQIKINNLHTKLAKKSIRSKKTQI